MIPVCEPTLQGNELKYITEAVTSGWISSAGKYLEEFENKFANYCGVKYGVACTSGTSAIHLAIEALGIGRGDEVIVPTFTMIASANAVIYAGAKPVFVDSEMDTWNMDPDKIEQKITPRTKAIMVVHTYGHPVDMDKIKRVANRYKIPIIEDAAEAHGAEYKGRKTGSLGDIACFSFYANKLITTGEGGMVVTDNKSWADRVKYLKNHCFGEPRFLHYDFGHCLRMTNIQAALGLAQLERLEAYVDARRRNAKLYNSLLNNVRGIVTPPEAEWAKNVYWMYGILVKDEFGMSMPKLREELKKRGVDTRTFFIGMHKQPVYRKNDERFPKTNGEEYPVAEELEKRGLYLPSSSHLSESEINTVVNTIKDIQRETQI